MAALNLSSAVILPLLLFVCAIVLSLFQPLANTSSGLGGASTNRRIADTSSRTAGLEGATPQDSKVLRATRKLQDDPCQAASGEVTFQADDFNFYRPSYFTQCASSLAVNTDNMKLHIESIKGIFQQYHCFYDIAKDPSASKPQSFQPELGNSIYGEGNGVVDLGAGLDRILADIALGGATMATFWEIQSLFNLLVDGHVALPGVQDDFLAYDVIAVPQRNIPVSSGAPLYVASLDATGTLQLNLDFGTGGMDVASINGKSVAEFMIDLANSPEVSLPYSSVGARVNLAVASEMPFGNFFFGSGTPSKILPDDFVVTYADGTSEVFNTGILPSLRFESWLTLSGDDVLTINRTAAETFINQPGEQYDAYERATRQIANLTSPRRYARLPKKKPTLKKVGVVSTRQSESSSYFNQTIPGKGGFRLEDDYAIMKLSTFDIEVSEVAALWEGVLRESKQKGITKLVVDISNNGGGQIFSGYILLFLMFPSLDAKWFQNQWDINYNEPMRLYLDALIPLIETITTNEDNVSDEEIQAKIDSFTETDLEVYQVAADAVLEICNDTVNPQLQGVPDETQCVQAFELQSNVTAFTLSRNPTTYVDLFLSLTETVLRYNPWTVLLTEEEAGPLIEAGVQPIVRGGVNSNVTARFNLVADIFDIDIREEVDAVTSRANFTFDEYVFVSNGGSGSMAAIFPFEAAQVYRNRDRSNVVQKVTLCGYGGTGNADDFALSSFPASVQGVNLQSPIMGDAALQLLIGLLPDSVLNEQILETASQYSASVALPPFFGSQLPLAPVINYYDTFMGPDALPLQYIKIPLDQYIPTMYGAVDFENDSDLPELYKRTAAFFTPATATSTTMPAAPEPSAAPSMALFTPAPMLVSPIPAPSTTNAPAMVPTTDGPPGVITPPTSAMMMGSGKKGGKKHKKKESGKKRAHKLWWN